MRRVFLLMPAVTLLSLVAMNARAITTTPSYDFSLQNFNMDAILGTPSNPPLISLVQQPMFAVAKTDDPQIHTIIVRWLNSTGDVVHVDFISSVLPVNNENVDSLYSPNAIG